MTAPFTRVGKQILTRDGEHYADAVDEKAAEFTLAALLMLAQLRGKRSA